MDPKPNLINDLSYIICDKDLVAENEVLKVKLDETNKKNKFLRSEVKNLKVLLGTKIQTYSHTFKVPTKECFVHENFDIQL